MRSDPPSCPPPVVRRSGGLLPRSWSTSSCLHRAHARPRRLWLANEPQRGLCDMDRVDGRAPFHEWPCPNDEWPNGRTADLRLANQTEAIPSRYVCDPPRSREAIPSSKSAQAFRSAATSGVSLRAYCRMPAIIAVQEQSTALADSNASAFSNSTQLTPPQWQNATQRSHPLPRTAVSARRTAGAPSFS
jgi:hypothetical protein